MRAKGCQEINDDGNYNSLCSVVLPWLTRYWSALFVPANGSLYVMINGWPDDDLGVEAAGALASDRLDVKEYIDRSAVRRRLRMCVCVCVVVGFDVCWVCVCVHLYVREVVSECTGGGDSRGWRPN